MSIKFKIIVPLGLIALMAAGCNFFNKSSNTAPVSSETNSLPVTQGQHNVVTYTDSGFSPKTLTIKKGDTVVFKNSASDDVRVASNPHPIHNGYPTTGGCVSSTFDSCSNIAPGQSWSFKFDIVGSWGYHNHLNPSEGGIIVVQDSSAQAPPPAGISPKKSNAPTSASPPTSQSASPSPSQPPAPSYIPPPSYSPPPSQSPPPPSYSPPSY